MLLCMTYLKKCLHNRAAPSIGVMLANMQVAFMMTQCVDHIQRLLVGPDDRWLAKGNPDVSRVCIDIGPSPCAEIFGVVLGVSRFHPHGHAHAVRRRGGSI